MSSFGSSVATGVSGGSAAGDVSLNDVSVHLAQGVDLEHIYELDALDTALDLAYTDVEVRNEGYQGLAVSFFSPPFFRVVPVAQYLVLAFAPLAENEASWHRQHRQRLCH